MQSAFNQTQLHYIGYTYTTRDRHPNHHPIMYALPPHRTITNSFQHNKRKEKEGVPGWGHSYAKEGVPKKFFSNTPQTSPRSCA